MIQRIQSVYMLIVTVLLTVALCLPIGNLIDPNGATHVFKPLGIVLETGRNSTWGLFCLLMVSTIIEALTIFLYKVRVLQLRMLIFNCLIIVGYYLVFGAFCLVLSEDVSFSPGVGLVLPVIGIVLNYLAIRGIMRDEAMVHAADRLR